MYFVDVYYCNRIGRALTSQGFYTKASASSFNATDTLFVGKAMYYLDLIVLSVYPVNPKSGSRR